MKKLCTFGLHQHAQAGLLKEVLAQEGIACVVRNDQLSAGLGEIPFVELFPELWVLDDEIYPRARLLLDQWVKGQDKADADWTCPECGELLEGQFGACWQCGRIKGGSREPGT